MDDALRFHGPVSAHRLDTDKGMIYLFGELHDFDGGSPVGSVYLPDVLDSSGFSEIWLELNDPQELLLSVYAAGKSPMLDFRKMRLQRRSHRMFDNLVYADVRYRSVFRMLSAIIDMHLFLGMYLNDFEAADPDPDPNVSAKKITKLCLSWEKTCFNNIRTSTAMFRLLESLVDPRVPYPPWFVEGLQRFESKGLRNTPNVVHEAMESLSPHHTGAILQYVRNYWHDIVHPGEHTAAMSSVIRAHRSDGSRLVLSRFKNAGIKEYFVCMLGIVTDVYVCAKILADPSKRSARCILMGENHIRNVRNMLLACGVVRDTSKTALVKGDATIRFADALASLHPQEVLGVPSHMLERFHLRASS